MKKLQEISDEIATKRVEKIGSLDTAHNNALKRLITASISRAFTVFSDEMITDANILKLKPGVTVEFFERYTDFISS